MTRLLILFSWAFVSCVPSLDTTRASEIAEIVSMEASFQKLAKRSSERLQMPFLLGGEDVSALYLEWENMFRICDDEKLSPWFERLPEREKGAIWYFVQGLEEYRGSHPRFITMVTKHRTTDAPALSVTDE